MFQINEDKSIYLTRGDIASIEVATTDIEGNPYTFGNGDVVRLKVFEKKDCECVVLQKDVVVNGETTVVDIFLTSEDTKIGGLIDKPKEYQYEIELNPDTAPQTFIGHDEEGAKVFKLFPEGADR